jgi:protocatechuate 3,4-dioxygenase beta subunit
MVMRQAWIRTIAVGAGLSLAAAGADRATLSGRVVDAAGKAMDHATVLVYSAEVRTGYSTQCPTCYIDCGKRTFTDAAGAFTLAGLASDLVFRLMVVRDGYTPAFVAKADPAAGPAQDAVLSARPTVMDTSRVLRGRVVNAGGVPVRDAIVRPEGVAVRNVEGQYKYSSAQDADPIAVTSENGEFEIAYVRPAAAMILMVEARGMAPRRFRDVFMGPERSTLTVNDGAMVRGRLVQNGKPVAGVQVGLYSRVHMDGRGYDEVRVGTAADGSFVFPNVPAPDEWYVYGKMEALAARGAVAPVKIATKADGEVVDVGDLQVAPGFRVKGTVVLSDGNPLPEGMQVFMTPACMSCNEVKPLKFPSGMTVFDESFQLMDIQTVTLGPDGRFEFRGLAGGPYHVHASVKGYGLAAGYKMLPHQNGESGTPNDDYNNQALRSQNTVETMVRSNVDGLVIKLEPITK